MSALAAAQMGIKVIIFTPERDSPASQVSAQTIVAPYEDQESLAKFATMVDVISYEFENIPLETVSYLKTLKPVFPDEKLLEVSQDRISEKSFLNKIGIETAKWMPINTLADVEKTVDDWGTPDLILKTNRFGYDGKGQKRLSGGDNLSDTIARFNGQELIAESIVDFAYDKTVIVARDIDGKTVTNGPMLNEHKHHILHKTTVPCPENDLNEQAILWTKTLADELDLIGVLTLELFVTNDGRLLANEIAPRTHNSGHWSIDGCVHSQFENHVRAVCGFPVLDPGRHSDAEMINLIGEDIYDIERYAKQAKTCIHDYGKSDVQPGRKMGHVTILK